MDITESTDRISRLEKRLEREKRARAEAESLLEDKSRELYDINKKLYEETRLLEATVINAKDGVIITDADLDNGPTIQYVNQAFTKLSGYTAEEVIGQTPRILQGDGTNRETLDDLRATLSKGKSFQGELKNYTKDGDPYWLDISIVPFKNEEGEITHYTAIERNITDRKIFEKELEESRKKAETANEAKGEFLANMSHELRTPMNGIIGLSDLLADTKLDHEQTESVEAINNSAESLLILLNDILDFSKIEAGEMSLENVPFDLKETVEETVNLLKTQADKKGIALSINCAPSVPQFILSDSARIRQILTNLIGNGLKFTEKGSVSLDISTQLSGEEPMIFFRIDDTGIGIPKDKLEAIFLKFTQADESTTRRFGGTGLGLAISKTLVQMMGGRMGVDSIEGEGSSFWFEIPLVKAREDLIQHSSSNQKHLEFNGEGVRVLVVDDHPVNLMFARKLLKKMGIERVQLADSGEEAFEYTQVGMYDVILMDCQMPGMDGFQATEAIRKMHKGQALHTPIIAVTANAMKGDRERCLAAGMDDYISKPIKPDILAETLAKWIEARPAEDKMMAVHIDPVSEPEKTPGDTDIPVDLEHFNFMFEDSDPEEIKELTNLFDEQALLSIAELEKHCRDGEQEDWKKAAHKLKGSAANLGAIYLAKACEDAEQNLSAPQAEKTEILRTIQSEFKRLQNYLLYDMLKE